jgi:uncharacterized membrane protein
MNIRKIIAFLIVLLSFIVGVYFYPLMPSKMASHWDINGNVNGYMSKFWGLFLMPIISLTMLLLFIFLPKLDPQKENYKKFQKYFDNFIILLLLFLFYIYGFTIFWSLGQKMDVNLAISPAFAVLFYYASVLIEKSKRNWFVGIRTPWTLSSDIVWDKTHKLGGKLFKICAFASLLGLLWPEFVIFFVLLPVILFTIFIIIYSYLEYKKIK